MRGARQERVSESSTRTVDRAPMRVEGVVNPTDRDDDDARRRASAGWTVVLLSRSCYYSLPWSPEWAACLDGRTRARANRKPPPLGRRTIRAAATRGESRRRRVNLIVGGSSRARREVKHVARLLHDLVRGHDGEVRELVPLVAATSHHTLHSFSPAVNHWTGVGTAATDDTTPFLHRRPTETMTSPSTGQKRGKPTARATYAPCRGATSRPPSGDRTGGPFRGAAGCPCDRYSEW